MTKKLKDAAKDIEVSKAEAKENLSKTKAAVEKMSEKANNLKNDFKKSAEESKGAM
tara:strand:+ start:502 stop:669 length:168 start_codon:yes stop_codon:yes gene_type:complete